MDIKLKPLDEQVIVITGADSGIGLATARAAAERGARVVMNSRDADQLRRVAAEIEAAGGQGAWHSGDVADPGVMQALARTAVEHFGRIDTWVNNAGVSIYGEIERVPLEDARRLFETNYWGMVNGSLAALPHLKASGGALINVGSVVSDVALPIQGHYSASKHAVKGFTNALRMELAEEGAPVVVTLVKPGSINTPFPEHARNLLTDGEPTLPPPVYAPEVVADAILQCAEHPTRDLVVGGGGKVMSSMRHAPRLADTLLGATMFGSQKRKRQRDAQDDSLYEGQGAGEAWGDYEGHTMRSSAYTAAASHKGTTVLALAAVGAGVALAARAGLFGERRHEDPPLM